MTHTTITRQHINEKQRIQHTADLFGILFPLSIEPTVYSFASSIATEYNGAYWEFYALSNGGFYMAPSSEESYQVSCENGYEGTLSADALGITVCLYAYGHLSFSNNQAFAELCANQYRSLRDYMLQHQEVRAILSAID
jgi:hypothetical protein